ncbi:MAG: 1-deoxy-D-xylulose-5-phosphate synthase [bacterium]
MDKMDTLNFLMENKDYLPRHVAIIMDGNGRWAKQKGLPRYEGHRAGAERVEPILEVCRKLNIPITTLFAFSTENWNRPEAEVKVIMELLNDYIDKETDRLKKNKVRLNFIGNPDRLTPELKQKMAQATEATSEDYKFTLNICVNYGGRDELLHAVRALIADAQKQNVSPEHLTLETLAENLFTSGLPDPDLLIRTGGEHRISNFLLWQIAYTEIIFHQKLWPDFYPEDFMDCLKDYLSRDRRFGHIAEIDEPLLAKIQSPQDLKKFAGKELNQLADEIRQVIISRVSENGGHLSSNLGIVELTIALHKVFDSPKDKLIWDVGHQCYPHKLLTGRYNAFASLRSRNGLSGFPNRKESEHDCFNTGHGSTSISAALGMVVARDISGETSHVVSICGDGAMSGGMVFEALNHAGEIGKNLIVILNDNSFSISPVTGALSRYLSRIRTSIPYVQVHQTLRDLKSHPSGIFGAASFLSSPLRRLGKYFAFKKGIIFEELGFTYVGPVNGHNIHELTAILEKVKRIKGPVLVHVLTCKGKGYEPAENDPATYHGVSRLEPDADGGKPDILPGATFTHAFCESLRRICKKDERIVGVTAAMSLGTGLHKIMEEYPHRFFDVGMAEPHAVTFAAGLAARGLRPVVAIYSTFLQRAYDQIFHDVCLQDLPVVFALDRAGLVSKYGQTHQGLMDIAYLRHLPNIILLAPRDTVELDMMLEYALQQDHPVAIRYPGDSDVGAVRMGARPPIEHRCTEIMYEGSDLTIWAVGAMAVPALNAAKILKQHNINARVINTRFVHPIDDKTLLKSYEDGIREFFTVEDHLLPCGFGSLLLEAINHYGLEGVHLTRLGIKHSFIPDDSRKALLNEFGLTSDGIAAQAVERFKIIKVNGLREIKQ